MYTAKLQLLKGFSIGDHQKMIKITNVRVHQVTYPTDPFSKYPLT